MVDVVPDASTLPPLVGREEDLALLTSVALSDGGLALLGGDAGIGKTRLLAEVAAAAREAGRRVLLGHCVADVGASLPYLPFAEVLAEAAADPGLRTAALEAAPAVAALLPDGSGLAEPAATIERGALYAGVHAALEAVAAHGPVLLVLEDVHWADASSRDLVTLLLTRGFRGPVSVVVSYRSDDLHRRHPLRPALVAWSRLVGVRRLELGPLSDAAVADLVARLHPGLAPAEVGGVVRRAEGNAFFAEELAAASRGGGTGEDLSRLLLSRVEGLDARAQAVVRLAAVAGRRVGHDLLARLVLELGLASDPADLDVLLRQAVERHVLVPVDRSGYAFRHALLAEAVHDDVLPGERLGTHRALAEAIRADPALGTAGDLARHAVAAGERALAARASLDAARDAMRVGGPAEALRHAETAMTLLGEIRADGGGGDAGDDDLDAATLAAAAAATAVGRLDRALALLREALDRRGGTMLPERRAEVLGRVAALVRMTEEDVDRLALVEEALALVDRDGPVRAGLLGLRAEALMDAGREAEAARVAEDAMGLAVRLDLRDLQSEVGGTVARLAERGGDPQESLRRLESVSTAGRATDLALLRTLHQIGSLHHRQDRLPEALAAFLRAAGRAREVGLPWAPYGLDARVMAAVLAYETGDWDTARRLTDHRGEDPPPAAAASLDAAGAYVAAATGRPLSPGDLERIRRYWPADGLIAIQSGSAALDALGTRGETRAAGRLHAELVAFLRRTWREERVDAEARLAALRLGPLAEHADRVPARDREALLAEAAELLAAAGAVWPPGGPVAPGTEGVAWLARVRAENLRLRQRVGVGDVDPADLVAAWREAATAFARRGDPYEEARSRARLAEALRVTGDAAAAADEASRARAHASRLGARPLLAELDRARGPGAGRGGPYQSGSKSGSKSCRESGRLTARELEVLRLLDAGRTNGDIGRQLFISTKTASVHVSNIPAKLGAGSRGEAVALARDRGLLGSG